MIMTILFATAIPFNTGTHANYVVKGKEVYDKYYSYLIRISAQHVPKCKPITMAKLVDWLKINATFMA
jgi:hypothetical protein